MLLSCLQVDVLFGVGGQANKCRHSHICNLISAGWVWWYEQVCTARHWGVHVLTTKVGGYIQIVLQVDQEIR